VDISDLASGTAPSVLLIGWALTTAFMLSELLHRVLAKADIKAYTLLKEWLSPEQLALFKSKGYFEVKGSHSGKRYRIRCAPQLNIDQLDAKGAPVKVWCFGPAGNLPVGDIMLAQKIALETDEQGALSLLQRSGSLPKAPKTFSARSDQGGECGHPRVTDSLLLSTGTRFAESQRLSVFLRAHRRSSGHKITSICDRHVR
jgi:hypothetical protein